MEPPKVTVVDYNPEWPQMFECESEIVSNVLDDRVMVIAHFGSTSVPGLAAKPIIDFCVILKDQKMAPEAIDLLGELGYWVKKDWNNRTVLRRSDTDEQQFNLHLGWPETIPEVKGNLMFREYLRDNPSMRDQYGKIKREAADSFPDDIGEYYNAKNPIIKQIMENAQEDGYWEEIDLFLE